MRDTTRVGRRTIPRGWRLSLVVAVAVLAGGAGFIVLSGDNPFAD